LDSGVKVPKQIISGSIRACKQQFFWHTHSVSLHFCIYGS
jgi:hypothetical protein